MKFLIKTLRYFCSHIDVRHYLPASGGRNLNLNTWSHFLKLVSGLKYVLTHITVAFEGARATAIFIWSSQILKSSTPSKPNHERCVVSRMLDRKVSDFFALICLPAALKRVRWPHENIMDHSFPWWLSFATMELPIKIQLSFPNFVEIFRATLNQRKIILLKIKSSEWTLDWVLPIFLIGEKWKKTIHKEKFLKFYIVLIPL